MDNVLPEDILMKWTQRLTNFFATSLQRKLLLVVTVVVTLVMIAFGFYLVNSQRQTASTELEDRATRTADLLAQTTALPLWNIDTASIEAQFKALMADPEVSSVDIYETGKSQPTVTSAQETAAVDPITREAEIILLRGEEQTSLGTVQIVYTRELLYRSLNQTQTLIGLIVLALILLLVVSIYFVVGRLVTNPLHEMTALTSRVSAGDYTGRANLTSRDEMSMLASAFNTMTAQLQGLISGLEQRVAARTEQLQASAEVGRTAASVLEPDELLRSVVNLITDRFGFYYAAVFIVDSSGRNAVLREATGEAGRILKERGHQLEVNGQSMVGYAVTRRRPRIALDVGEEAVRFANPLLPDTRSEIALPLIVGDRVLGALDVQSTQEAAFDEANAAVLQAMADQVAMALNNALSYTETEALARRSRALFAASSEVGHLQTDLAETIRATVRAAAETMEFDHWCVLTFNEIRTALVSIAAHNWPEAAEALDVQAHLDHPLVTCIQRDTDLFITDANDVRLRELRIDGLRGLIGVPIKTRDTIVGVLAFSRTHGRELVEGDLEVGRSLANLIAVAIENHNLVETSQRTLRELDEINRSLTGQSWERFVRRQDKREIIWVSHSDQLQPQQLPEVSEALTQGRIATRTLDDAQQLGVAVPIKLRDVPVGALRLIIPRRTWNPEMAAALDSIAGHVAQAAENARLITETEQRLTRERALADATEKVRQRNEVETILQTAATELARYLNASHIAVRLSPEHSPPDGNGQ